MKTIFFPLFIMLLSITLPVVSCSSKNKHSINVPVQKYTTFELIDSLRSITLNLPTHTDTFFNWIRRSACGGPCEEGRYRFLKRSTWVFKESGWLWIDQPEDSVAQLTITHSRNIYFKETPDSFLLSIHSLL